MTHHLYLTGFMASGKTYLGRQLAQLLEWDFIDLDDLIESRTGKSITEIFTTEGEDRFRRLESETLRSLSTLEETAVVSCGGGTPCYLGNQDWMLENGKVVFLDVSEEILTERLVAGAAHRPLAAERADLTDFIREKLASRRPIYEKAHIRLVIDNPNAPVARLLYEQLAKDGY
ncbi:shikimate kinase [Lewinellaceae bacterium SD302]|nr:shikimate kinase [Lewinellaceae bacterium SD302]